MIPHRLSWRRAIRLIEDLTEEVAAPQLVDRPLATVCLLTYNHGSFVRKAIESVLEQETPFPFELLISEDRSSDETREIVREAQARHPTRVRLLLSHERLGGYTGNGRLSLVRSLQRARGTHIALLEGDDYWCDREKLDLQLRHLTSTDCAGTFHDTLLEYPDDNRPTEPWPHDYGGREEFFFRDTINTETLFHTSSFVFRRSSIPSKLPEWFLRVASGDLALYNLCASTGTLRRIPRVMSVTRRHSGGVTRTSPLQTVHGIPINRLFMYRHLRRHHGRELAAFDAVIEYFDTRLVEILSGFEPREALAGLKLHRWMNGTLHALPTMTRVASRLARGAYRARRDAMPGTGR